jgi:cytochrome c oxidase assembly factor CtaG
MTGPLCAGILNTEATNPRVVTGGHMLAYTYPLLSIFWTMLIFAGIFLMIWFIIWCFVDNFRRKDHHGMAKAGWTILILFLPIIGALIYIIARPAEADANV